MRRVLILLFVTILLAMVTVTTVASMHQNILDAGSALWPDWWFRATLCDAYFGFITFYVWVAYKESTVWKRGLWLVLIMGLGNIAMAIYVLIQLVRLPAGQSVDSILLAQRTSD